jgi:cytoskeleton protein RodZ
MSEQGQLIPTRPGEALRERRLERGLTIAYCARQLRIRESALQAIENDETGGIAPVYLKGFLRSYAAFLDIPLDDDRFDRAWREGADPELRSIHSAAAAEWGAERWLKVTSYVVASLLIAALAWQFTHQAVRFSQGESPLVVETPAPERDQDGAPSTETPSQPADGANRHINASIASIELLRKNRDSAGQDAWAALAAPPEADTPDIPQGHARLSLSASADTWVEIRDADQALLEMDLLRGGTERSYVGLPPFDVLVGRASAVQVTLDDEPVDLSSHTRGNVARLTLAPTVVADASDIPEAQSSDH